MVEENLTRVPLSVSQVLTGSSGAQVFIWLGYYYTVSEGGQAKYPL